MHTCKYIFILYCKLEGVFVLMTVMVLSHSMKRTHLQKLQAVSDYWRAKSESYYSRSDGTPATNSQDSEDHGIWLVDI